MSTALIVSNIVLAAGVVLLAIASLVKIKHFYYGGKSEYLKQFAYSGVALVTLAAIALLIAYSQYQVAAENLLLEIDEIRNIVGI